MGISRALKIRAIPVFLLLLIAAPILSLIPSAMNPEHEAWAHVVDVLLPTAMQNTLLLMLTVSIGTTILGVVFGYVTARYQFLGSKIWSLVIPIGVAFPGYVLAFLFIDIFDFSGPAQTWLRNHALPIQMSVRNFWGLSLVMTLALAPYMFLLSRLGFERQGQRMRQG